jgi:hypothetical protein
MYRVSCYSVVLLLIGIPACNNSDTDTDVRMGDVEPGGDTPPAEEMTYGEFLTQFVASDCARELACEAGSEMTTVEDCIANIDPGLTLQRARLEASVTAGKVHFFPDVASDCLTLLESECNTDSLTILTTCGDVVEGALSVGDFCLANFV